MSCNTWKLEMHFSSNYFLSQALNPQAFVTLIIIWDTYYSLVDVALLQVIYFIRYPLYVQSIRNKKITENKSTFYLASPLMIMWILFKIPNARQNSTQDSWDYLLVSSRSVHRFGVVTSQTLYSYIFLKTYTFWKSSLDTR